MKWSMYYGSLTLPNLTIEQVDEITEVFRQSKDGGGRLCEFEDKVSGQLVRLWVTPSSPIAFVQQI